MKINIVIDIHHQSHIWQNAGSRFMGQNPVGQSNSRIL